MPPHPKQKMETPKKMFGTPKKSKNYRQNNSPLGREGSDKGISRKAAPSILVLFLLLTGIVACSATLIIVQTAPAQDKAPTEWFDESATDEQTTTTLLTDTTHASSTTTTTEAAQTTTTTTTTSTTTTTIAALKAANPTRLRPKTTTPTSTTTTTTIPCGGDMQPACEKGVEGCDEGNVLGTDNICHTPICLPSVDSGLHEGNCGAFALRFCK
jgi:cytoskeletal protein RodZ